MPFFGSLLLVHTAKDMEEGIIHCMIYLFMWLNVEKPPEKNKGRQDQKWKTEKLNKVERLQMQLRGKGKVNIYCSLSFANYMPVVLTYIMPDKEQGWQSHKKEEDREIFLYNALYSLHLPFPQISLYG